MKLYPLTLTFALAFGLPALLLAQDDLSFDEFAAGDESEEEVAGDGADDEGGTATEVETTATSDQGGGSEASGSSSSDAGEEEAEGGEDFESEDTIGQPLSERIKAVSRHFFLKKNRFELTPAMGLSMNDAFFRNYIVQVDATYHILEPLAVELRVGGSFIGEPLEPVRFLRDEFTVLTDLIRPVYFVDLSGSFTPLYGKTSLFADWIWHYDMYVAGGLGVTGVAMLGGANLDMQALAHQPTLNLGGGMRGFVTRWLVVHVDVRDYIFPGPSAPGGGDASSGDPLGSIQNLLVLSIGAGFYFPFDFEHDDDGFKEQS